jgi:predicted dehydrogenase
MKRYPEELRIVGVFDVDPSKANNYAQKLGVQAYPSYEALLGDSDVELVVDLAIHKAHGPVNRQALLAGKHVHSEKPLSTERKSGKETVQIARRKGLMLSCSPFVSLGEAQQTLWKTVRDGKIGDVVAVTAEMFWGRIERWHPNPVAFYEEGAGPMLDVGVYPLNVLTTVLGPVSEVRGLAEITLPDREIFSGALQGKKFQVTTPDVVFGLLKFEMGAIGRLSTTFSPWRSKQGGMELHGTKGSLWMSTCVGFDSTIEMALYPDQDWKPVPLLKEPFKGVDWGRGIAEGARAIREGRPSRVSGEQAYHILDVCLSILESSRLRKPVKVKSRFQRPAPVQGFE